MTPPVGSLAGAELATALVVDSLTRVHEALAATLDGLAADELGWRPQPDANPVGWLAWHLSRVEDDHLADIAGVEQAWTAQGFAERFGLPYAVHEHGYGHDREQVDAFAGTVPDLTAYHAAVTALGIEVLRGLDADAYAAVVDDSWDPPVTAAARIVSVIDEINQHVGQMAYVRGLIERR